MTYNCSGRKPPKGAPAIHFATLLSTGALPVFPSVYDSISGWTGWQMLGNDRYGVCVSVSWATERRIVTNGGTYPDWGQVQEFYKTQNPTFPAEDNGMDIQTALEELVNVGGPDSVKAIAFAKVDHTNLDEMKAALSYFKTLWLGVNVTAENQTQFPNIPWTTAGSVKGGHSIVGTGYDTRVVKIETWAHEASLADSYVTSGTATSAGLEEAWVVIWPEHLVGLSDEAQQALATAYQDVTGKTLVLPNVNPPAPVDPDHEFATVLRKWLARVPKVFKALQAAALKWLDAKGL